MTFTVPRTDRPIISHGMPSQPPDADPHETAEWLASLDGVVDALGPQRARYLVLRLTERARQRQDDLPALRSTDDSNTIPPEREADFPGDGDVERRIHALIRWNAAVAVTRANRPEIGVGGRIATYQSAASLALGQVDRSVVVEAAARYRIDDPVPSPVGVSAGGDS